MLCQRAKIVRQLSNGYKQWGYSSLKYRGGAFTSQIGNTSLQYMRDSDAVGMLADGEVDLTFIGDDKLGEWAANGTIAEVSVVDSMPINCRFVLAGARARVRDIPTQLGKGDLLTVTTGYPKLLEAYAVEQGLNLRVTCTPEGACEGFASNGKTDLIFDIMKTGDSIRDNELLVYREGEALKLEVIDEVTYAQDDERDSLAVGLDKVMATYLQRLRQARQPQADGDSYTTELLREPNKMYKKLGEEFAEVMQALLRSTADRREIVNESADLLYALELLLTTKGIGMRQVLEENIARNRPVGEDT